MTTPPGLVTIEHLTDELEAARSYIDRLIIAADRREAQLAEAWDEVERLRGENERLKLEKFDLAERLQQQGSLNHEPAASTVVGMDPASAAATAVAGRTREGTR
jgi:regulator of replication initiation timing